MALVTPRVVFYHIPCTGGMWVRNALRVAGVSFSFEAGQRHSLPCEVSFRGRFSMTFVRHPVSWYQSYFKAQLPLGSRFNVRRDAFDGICQCRFFDVFLERAMFLFPGYVSGLYKFYSEIGTSRQVDFIGKQENLAEDLIKALGMAGEDFNEGAIRNLPKLHENPLRPLKWNRKILEQILQQERFALEQFGYEMDYAGLQYEEKGGSV